MRNFGTTTNKPTEGTRLNKHIASCGIASRRKADELIFEGKVTVNKEICINPAYRVKPSDNVNVEGKVTHCKDLVAIITHKLPGLIVTKNDELERDTVYQQLPSQYQHLNYVGRLDRDSEGLLVFTNDGTLGNALTHPKHKIEKEYIVTANQPFEDSHLNQFLKGVYLEEGRAAAKAITRITGRRISMTLDTGMKRQIRNMCRALGYQVKQLKRVRIGSYQGLDLNPGEVRELLPGEIQAMLRNPSPKNRPPIKKDHKKTSLGTLKKRNRKRAE